MDAFKWMERWVMVTILSLLLSSWNSHSPILLSPPAKDDFSLLLSPDMSETVLLKVGMACKGCVGAVERVLDKMEGVESFNVDIEQQKVTVKGSVQPQDVLEKVSKTGKKTEFWKEEEETLPKESTPADAPSAETPKEEVVDTPIKESTAVEETVVTPSDKDPKQVTDAPKEAAPPAQVDSADGMPSSEAPKDVPAA